MHAINQPDIAVGPLYKDKTVELCVPDDFVCSSGGDFNAHTQYVEAGLVDQAATFTATKLAAIPPPAGTPDAPLPAAPAQTPVPAAPPKPAPAPAAPAPAPAAPPLSTIPAAPPPPAPAPPPPQRGSQTILSCTTVCHVIGPE
jgi:hypothetical protein